MKEVRIALDDALYQRVETLAAERGVTMDDLLRSFVVSHVGSGEESEEAYRSRMKLVEMARRQDIPRRLIPWTREELHDRDISGYERDRLRGLGSGGGSGEVGESGGDHGT